MTLQQLVRGYLSHNTRGEHLDVDSEYFAHVVVRSQTFLPEGTKCPVAPTPLYVTHLPPFPTSLHLIQGAV